MGRTKRLIVTMPPRHGKSELISKIFPAWYLGHNPDNRVIMASYGADFAATWGAQARDYLLEHGPGHFGSHPFRKEKAAADNWRVNGHRGGMRCAGVGGSLTGLGGDLIIVDDPVKNDAEAISEVYREKTWNWFNATLYTRLEPGGAMVVVMTRWHNDDLVGRLLAEMKKGGEEWEHLDLPAIALDDDAMGRSPGEPLWPERYDLNALARIKRQQGPYWWSALYMQNPQMDGRGQFRRSRFRYFYELDDYFYLMTGEGEESRFWKGDCRIFQTIDTAMKEKEHNDYTVISTFALTPDNQLLILDIHRERLTVPKQWPLIVRKAQEERPEFQAIEDKGSGTGLIQRGADEGFPFRPLAAVTDKVTRAEPASVAYENYLIYHRQNAHWLDDFEKELIEFPLGKHDDMVDTVAYAWRWVEEESGYAPDPPDYDGGAEVLETGIPKKGSPFDHLTPNRPR